LRGEQIRIAILRLLFVGILYNIEI
jgi:hypothetical protein